MTINGLLAGDIQNCEVYKISPNDSNKFVILCDGDQVPFVSVVEIFDINGKTPPNEHAQAFEYFYVIAGQGIAVVGDSKLSIGAGSFFIVSPGSTHAVHNTGNTRLYVLTTMVPDEGFSKLIRSGPKAGLDAEDLKVLRRSEAHDSKI